MYGIQTAFSISIYMTTFENDVKMYGIQTIANEETSPTLFENDVKMYGIQTKYILMTQNTSLRMM